jgi:hypothetical protein
MVCPQVNVECPACGHAFVAVPESPASCAGCGRELAWSELAPDGPGYAGQPPAEGAGASPRARRA